VDLTLEQCLEFAECAHQSGAYAAKNLATLHCDAYEAYRDGENPGVYFRERSIIRGKLTFSYAYIASRIKRHGYILTADITDDRVILWAERDGQKHETTFSLEDARKAGIYGPMWQKYPRNMLYARALTNMARFYIGEVFGQAVYTPDELQEADKADKPTKTKISPEALQAASQNSGEIQIPQPSAEGENLPKPITDDEWASLEDKTSDEVKAWAKANQQRMTTEEVFRVKALLLDKKIVQKRQLEAINKKEKED
jgi:hypothetical protein